MKKGKHRFKQMRMINTVKFSPISQVQCLFSLTLLVIFMSTCSSPQAQSPAMEVEKVQVPRSPLYTSSDYGHSWQDASYNLPQDIEASFLERIGEELLLATDNMGLFLSSQKRSFWTAIGNELPSMKINALHVFGKNIYVGPYRAGIYVSADQGQSWESLNYDLPDLRVQAIYQNEKGLLVGTDSGIFKLDEKAKKWLSVFPYIQTLSICEFQDKLIAGTSQGTLLSENQGDNWNWIHQEGAIHYTHIVSGHIVEMYVSGDLYFSSDWGKNWLSATYVPRADSYVYEVISVGKYWILSNNYGIHRSQDKGKSWRHIYPIEKMGFFDFLVFDDMIYAGTRAWDEYRGRE